MITSATLPSDATPSLGPSSAGAAIWSSWRRPAIEVDDAEAISLLRGALLAGEYTPDGFARVLREERSVRDDEGSIMEALRRLPAGDRTSTLVKLFHLGVRVDAQEAAAALAPLPLDRLVAMGLAARRDTELEPLVEIFPVAGVFVVSDPFQLRPGHHDHVAPVSTGTLTLAALTVREPVDAALDLGAGSGFQALLLSAHARRVVALDVNPRALRYTEFNAVLNDRRNIEVREGDLFEPVAGESFDLIVSNPPYVISPEPTYAFQDGGLRGDAFAEGLVRSVPAHLREGGHAFVLVEWLIAPGEDSSAPLRRWVAGNGCDAILFELTRQLPTDYALLWNRSLRGDAAAYGRAVDRWREHFEQLGAEQIGWGAIALRRRSGENWVATRRVRLPDRPDPASHHVRRLFAAEDLLAGRDDGSLLDARLEVAGDVVLDAQFTLSGGRRLVRRAALVLQGGLGFRATLDEFTLELVSRFDGTRTVGEVAGQLVAAGAEPSQAEAAAARAARQLIELGLVVPT